MAIEKSHNGNFGIITSGGPAPGINSVIAAVVISASKEGFKTYGFQRGFSGVVEQGEKAIIELTIPMVTPIANTGGSIIGTSRFNPFATPEGTDKFLGALKIFNIDKLVIIGGEGSAFLSHEITKQQDL
jgi:6-phosphofructokinase 1